VLLIQILLPDPTICIQGKELCEGSQIRSEAERVKALFFMQ